jgi:AcrR family transcriptional regulator
MEMADSAGSVEALSLTSLAQALDIRVPSLYNHIASLEDLQHAMTVAGLQGLVSALRQAAAGLVGQEALAAIAHAYRRFARTHPAIYPLTIRAPEPDDIELSALAQEVLQMLLLVMASLGLHGADALHAIRGLRAILHGFTSLEAAGGYKMPLDHDESFRRLVDTYLDGLEPPERARATSDVLSLPAS